MNLYPIFTSLWTIFLGFTIIFDVKSDVNVMLKVAKININKKTKAKTTTTKNNKKKQTNKNPVSPSSLGSTRKNKSKRQLENRNCLNSTYGKP